MVLEKKTIASPKSLDWNHCYIIAEAGVNHNGSIKRAHELVDAAASSGANAVKFQSFNAKMLATKAAPKAAYQKTTSDPNQSQLEMLRGLELDQSAHRELLDHCAESGIEFLSTPFDRESFAFLYSLGIRKIKIGSGDLNNAPLLLDVATQNCEVLLSTGMASLSEIEEILGVLAFGYLGKKEKPSKEAFKTAWSDSSGYKKLYDKVTLLHCTTEYPTPLDQVNLKAINTLQKAFGLLCGYSDHTQGINIAIASVVLGAKVLEKHVTLDRTLPGPDHSASLEVNEFAAMVKGIREVESSFGDGRKVPMLAELKNKLVARKSLVANRAISKGEILDENSVTAKRPGSGKEPIDFWDLLGSKATRDYATDDFFE